MPKPADPESRIPHLGVVDQRPEHYLRRGQESPGFGHGLALQRAQLEFQQQRRTHAICPARMVAL
jgi:hypothetical protein